MFFSTDMYFLFLPTFLLVFFIFSFPFFYILYFLFMWGPKMDKRGIIDVLVKVGKFIFPANFIILNMEGDNEIPILLVASHSWPLEVC